MSGLFQNCSQFLMLTKSEAYTSIIDAEVQHPVTVIRKEMGEFGTCHPIVGYIMGQGWDLPEEIALAIVYHHLTAQEADIKDKLLAVVSIMRLSKALGDGIFKAKAITPEQTMHLRVAMDTYNLDVDTLNAIHHEMVAAEAEESE
jgi:HD-like signal output (HDOD) protein